MLILLSQVLDLLQCLRLLILELGSLSFDLSNGLLDGSLVLLSLLFRTDLRLLVSHFHRVRVL